MEMAVKSFRNQTFDEIAIGATASASRTLTATDVEALALAAGDVEGYHIEGRDQMRPPYAQAAAAIALVAGLINRRLPGPGSAIVGTQFKYSGRVRIGDRLDATITVTAKYPAEHYVDFQCRCVNQDGDVLVDGVATVSAPTARIAYSDIATPELILRRNDGFAKLITRSDLLPPVACAVVHPCDRASIGGAVEAAKRGMIIPVLVGPEARIRAAAAEAAVDITPYRIVSVEHSHAAAAKAVELARAGDVESLMKGSLHTDELMGAVVASSGLRTARRISHCFVLDVPTYPRLLLLTDCAVNISPDLEVKADICRNAIDLAHVLGIDKPYVAILSAVETVNPKMPGTLDAAALCKMADRGQITGAVLDGPLAYDNAVSAEAALTKGIRSPVAGRVDILLVPDLEAGNMLAKQLQYQAGADSAGIVLGTRVPIVLTSRADSVRTRLASAAVMKLLAHARREKLAPPV